MSHVTFGQVSFLSNSQHFIPWFFQQLSQIFFSSPIRGTNIEITKLKTINIQCENKIQCSILACTIFHYHMGAHTYISISVRLPLLSVYNPEGFGLENEQFNTGSSPLGTLGSYWMMTLPGTNRGAPECYNYRPCQLCFPSCAFCRSVFLYDILC